MTSMVIDCDELPNTIMSYFQTGKVELVEKGGRVTLSPVDDEDPVAKRERQLAAIRKARGMWKGLGSSSEKFMRNKKFEKELEERQSKRRCAKLSPMDIERQLAFIKNSRGMFAGRGWSSERFMKNKKFEKALEV